LEHLFSGENIESLPQALQGIRGAFSDWEQEEPRTATPVHVHVLETLYSRREALRGLTALNAQDRDRVQRVVEAAKETGVVVGLARFRFVEDGSGERLGVDDYNSDINSNEDAESDEEGGVRPREKREPLYGRQRYKPGVFRMNETLDWECQSLELFNLRTVSTREVPLPKPTSQPRRSRGGGLGYFAVDRDAVSPFEIWEQWDTPDVVQFEEDQVRLGRKRVDRDLTNPIVRRTCPVLLPYVPRPLPRPRRRRVLA
jgi:hypothetical protein